MDCESNQEVIPEGQTSAGDGHLLQPPYGHQYCVTDSLSLGHNGLWGSTQEEENGTLQGVPFYDATYLTSEPSEYGGRGQIYNSRIGGCPEPNWIYPMTEDTYTRTESVDGRSEIYVPGYNDPWGAFGKIAHDEPWNPLKPERAARLETSDLAESSSSALAACAHTFPDFNGRSEHGTTSDYRYMNARFMEEDVFQTHMTSLNSSLEDRGENSQRVLPPPFDRNVRPQSSELESTLYWPNSQCLAPRGQLPDNTTVTSCESTSVGSSAIESIADSSLVCEHCGLKFTGLYGRGNLGRHQRIIHGTRSWLCEDNMCGKAFKRPDARLKHYRRYHRELAPAGALKRSHFGHAPHRCTERGCDREFERSTDLLRHQRTHLTGSERPHKCQTCDASFLYPKDLRRHESIHEDGLNTRFWCPVSGCSHQEAFSRKDNLQRHIRRWHPDASLE